VSTLTDVEISRALNALSTTFREQRPQGLDVTRAQQIVSGALSGESKLEVQATGPTSGELRIRGDGRVVATVELHEDHWQVVRKLHAGESDWALPEPAHRQEKSR
jgi:hypothetical protein